MKIMKKLERRNEEDDDEEKKAMKRKRKEKNSERLRSEILKILTTLMKSLMRNNFNYNIS